MHLGGDVAGHLAPREAAPGGEGQRDRRVDVRPADAAGDVDAERDREAPAPCDDQPVAAGGEDLRAAAGLVQCGDGHRHDAVAEADQHERAQALGEAAPPMSCAATRPAHAGGSVVSVAIRPYAPQPVEPCRGRGPRAVSDDLGEHQPHARCVARRPRRSAALAVDGRRSQEPSDVRGRRPRASARCQPVADDHVAFGVGERALGAGGRGRRRRYRCPGGAGAGRRRRSRPARRADRTGEPADRLLADVVQPAAGQYPDVAARALPPRSVLPRPGGPRLIGIGLAERGHCSPPWMRYRSTISYHDISTLGSQHRTPRRILSRRDNLLA